MSTTYLTGDEIVTILPGQIAELKEAAARTPFRRARLCLHKDHDDSVQEMVIAFCRGSYTRPHRHHGKNESFHIIEGQVAVVIFDDEGNVTHRLTLGPPGSGNIFIYRLRSSIWHAVIPLTNFVVLHETTSGPFEPGQSEPAPWAPDGSNQLDILKFLARLGCEAIDSSIR